MASLHFLGQYDRNEVQHDFSFHTLPMAFILGFDDAVSILSGTITFTKSWQWELDVR